MIAPSVGVPAAFCAVQFGVLLSPFIAAEPVRSWNVTPPDVFLAPLVTVHDGSVDEVPATMTTNTRSLPTAGVVSWRTSWPAVYAVDAANAVTAAV